MKKVTILSIFLFTFVGCAIKGGKTLSDLGEPDVFCTVIQKPDPLLMGTWEGRLSRTGSDWANIDKEYVMYKLMKYDDKYALYFYRTWQSGRKKIKEWKNWTINDKQILGPSQYGIRIFVQAGVVYFTIRGADEPARMSRVEG